MSDVTRLLGAIDHGDPKAAEELLPLVYGELRRLAAHKMANDAPGQTLQPTALVHEAYLRLVGSGRKNWNGQSHFFAAAAEAMRRILVENARRRSSLKRGGAHHREQWHESRIAQQLPDEQVLAVDEALDRLAATDSAASNLVKLRYFVGLSMNEAAEALGLPCVRPSGYGPTRGPGCGVKCTKPDSIDWANH